MLLALTCLIFTRGSQSKYMPHNLPCINRSWAILAALMAHGVYRHVHTITHTHTHTHTHTVHRHTQKEIQSHSNTDNITPVNPKAGSYSIYILGCSLYTTSTAIWLSWSKPIQANPVAVTAPVLNRNTPAVASLSPRPDCYTSREALLYLPQPLEVPPGTTPPS